jgi:hypothetical protein
VLQVVLGLLVAVALGWFLLVVEGGNLQLGADGSYVVTDPLISRTLVLWVLVPLLFIGVTLVVGKVAALDWAAASFCLVMAVATPCMAVYALSHQRYAYLLPLVLMTAACWGGLVWGFRLQGERLRRERPELSLEAAREGVPRR